MKKSLMTSLFSASGSASVTWPVAPYPDSSSDSSDDYSSDAEGATEGPPLRLLAPSSGSGPSGRGIADPLALSTGGSHGAAAGRQADAQSLLAMGSGPGNVICLTPLQSFRTLRKDVPVLSSDSGDIEGAAAHAASCSRAGEKRKRSGGGEVVVRRGCSLSFPVLLAVLVLNLLAAGCMVLSFVVTSRDGAGQPHRSRRFPKTSLERASSTRLILEERMQIPARHNVTQEDIGSGGASRDD